jgi:DNA polymerase-1
MSESDASTGTIIPLHRNGATPHAADDVVLAAPADADRVPGGEPSQRSPESQATKLVRLATGLRMELFHDPQRVAYATLAIDGHHETHALRSKPLRQFLARAYYLEYETTPGSQALQDAINVLEGRAVFEGPEHAVNVRRAERDGRLVIDLGGPTWDVVVVDGQGWRVTRDNTVRFRRPRGLLPLPEPVPGGSIGELRPFLNVRRDEDFLLIVAWTVQALRGTGPYPLLALVGEQGSGKSTVARVLRALVDPNVAPIRSEPREPRDLIIAANNSAVQAFDNISRVCAWLSDALCRLATGGAFGTRELYSDDEERLFDAVRPIVLNGIEQYVTRSDLLDRSVLVQLEQVPCRLPEVAFWTAFAEAAPRILGALLDGVSRSLLDASHLRIDPLPRMADFALNASAAMPAFGWAAAQFLDAYAVQRRELSELPLEASPIWLPLQALLSARAGSEPLWEGTAGELLEALAAEAGEKANRRRDWPSNGRVLSNQLRRLVPNLRAVGYDVTFARRPHTGERIIVITAVDHGGESCVTSVTSVTPAESTREERPAGDATGPAGDASASFQPQLVSPDPAEVTRGFGSGDASDAGDATSPASSSQAALAPALPQFTVSAEQITLVTTAEQLRDALPLLLAADMLGLDCETTGLNPRGDRLRLLQLATGKRIFIVDCFAVNPAALVPVFVGGACFVGHNLKFDLAFLQVAGLPLPARFFDTMLASQLLHAGLDAPQGTHTLAAVVARYLSLSLDKQEQRSDWSGPLSDQQVVYAAADAAVLLPLAGVLLDRLEQDNLTAVAGIEMRALPAMVRLERAGAPFDRAAWMRLSDAAIAEVLRLEEALAAEAARVDLFGAGTVNWGSPTQVAQLLRERGHRIERTDEATLQRLADSEPLAVSLLLYREADKRAGLYGIEFLKYVDERTGRLYADFLQLGSVAGRMSCTRPNLQNIPRDPAYRACFAAPPGRALVKADYSQIELRIAAQISQDDALLAAYRQGADVHTRTAAAVLGASETAVTKEQRQLAKALNFGLLYGMGAKRLREYAASDYRVTLSDEEAERFRERFFATYAGLRRWHRSQPKDAIETRTLAGRRRLAVDPFTHKLNSPVQGTGADILKLALARLWEDRHAHPDAVPVLVVHDEIVLECDADQAEAVAAWLTTHMEAAGAALVLDVPIVAEAATFANWSGTPYGA